MVRILVAGAVGEGEDVEREGFLFRLVLLVIEQPAQMTVAQVVFEMIEARERVGAVAGERRGFVEIAEEQAHELAAHQRRIGRRRQPALVVTAHDRGGGAERVRIKIAVIAVTSAAGFHISLFAT